MSLINEALKTAQKRNKLLKPHIEHPLFEAVVPYPARSDARRSRVPLLAGVFALVLAGAVGVRMYAPRLSPLALFGSKAIRPLARSASAAPVITPPASATTPAATVEQAGHVAAIGDSSKTRAPRTKPPLTVSRGAATAGKSADTTAHPGTSAAPAESDRVAETPLPAPTPPPVASPAPGVQITVEAGGVRPVDALMAQALSAQRRGDLKTAKQLYDRAIRTGPVSAALYNNYGALLTASGDARNAADVLRLALSLDRTFTNAWVNLGNALDAAGDHTGAVGAFEQALKLDPSNRESRLYLAEQYLALSSYADARRIAEDIVRLDPSYAPGHYVLARALESVKDFGAAVNAFTRFLDYGGAAGNPALETQVRSHIASLRSRP